MKADCKHDRMGQIEDVVFCRDCEAPEYIPSKDAAKIIRTELKKAFPEMKFSVKTHQYSMGSHVSIHYTDGPPTKAVEAITDQFYGTGFDGMTDSTTHHDSLYQGRPVHFGGSRPSVSRSFTNDTMINEFGRSVRNPENPHDKVEAMLKARIHYGSVAHYLPSQNAYHIISTWDARWETLERAVERYMHENVAGYAQQ
jgi:hypothetical protein